jgi:hypothetical protein
MESSKKKGHTRINGGQNMKTAAILAVMLFLAALPAPDAQSLQIATIDHTTGRFQLSNRTWWGALRPRDVQHWRSGDGVTGTRSAFCGSDPNVYLLTGTDQSESACALQIGR